MEFTKNFLCGCRIKVKGEPCTAKIEYCSKHKVAEEMYEALKVCLGAIDMFQKALKYSADCRAYSDAAQALVKAEGVNNAK